MAHDSESYTANGEPSGTTIVAFETKYDGNIEIGVGVIGTKCGVYGQSRFTRRFSRRVHMILNLALAFMAEALAMVCSVRDCSEEYMEELRRPVLI